MKRPRLPRSVLRSLPIMDSPVVRRVAWHVRRMVGQLDRRFFMSLAQGIIGFVLAAAVLITLFEKSWTIESVFDSFNWGIATVLGQGDSSYVTSPAGRLIGWFLILFGVAMLGMITGALVAMVIDFLLKEGQGWVRPDTQATSSSAAGIRRPVTSSTNFAATSTRRRSWSSPMSTRTQPATACTSCAAIRRTRMTSRAR